MTASEIINKYISFFEKRGHKRIVNSPLVPQNDPTTLFTSSGMQPLVPYLLGEQHPMGKRLVNVQNCFRAQDIDEVGDNRHTTFFRMLGNWSLGDYFKQKQLPWFFEFLTQELKLDPNRLYVTIFGGDHKFKIIENKKWQPLRPDLEAADIWTKIFETVGIEAKIANISTREEEEPDINKGRIFYYKADKNWWSRSGTPEQMPIGEIGGPDSEVFYDFGEELKLHESSPYKNKSCHANCNCGRFLEIGNSVFMQYKKIDDTTFEELPNKNVDFGGGLERLAAAVNNNPNIFEIDIFAQAKKTLEEVDLVKTKESSKSIQIILDHLQSSIFMIDSGVEPSNKEQGYILRRLIRRAKLHSKIANIDFESNFSLVLTSLINAQKNIQPSLIPNKGKIYSTIEIEIQRFNKTLDAGMKKILSKKGAIISGGEAFDYYQTYGYPPELIREFAEQNNIEFDNVGFDEAKKKHQNISRAGATKKFAGGLADTSSKTIRGHTATHLLHQALRDIFGTQLHQTGSNITAERVRFDFNFDRNLTAEELKKVEDIVNEKIKANLPVHFEMLPLKKAKEIGAIGLFDEKYEEKVKIYFIGDYSKEFCGGPHVETTSKVGKFSIIKQENIGKGFRRIYAKVD